jgi:hypothetical protein
MIKLRFIYIIIGLFLFSCVSTVRSIREISYTSQFSIEEYDIYNMLSNEVYYYNDIKIKKETQIISDDNILESDDIIGIQISRIYVVIDDNTSIPSYNKNMSANINYSRIREYLIFSFGKEYKDVINDFLKSNLADHKLNEYFESKAGPNILSFSKYLEKKDTFPQLNFGFINLNTIIYGPLILSRVGFNTKKDTALIEYELYGNIHYILLKKYNEWKIEKIVNRRTVKHDGA